MKRDEGGKQKMKNAEEEMAERERRVMKEVKMNSVKDIGNVGGDGKGRK